MRVIDLLILALAAALLHLGSQWFLRHRSRRAWRQSTERLAYTQGTTTPLTLFSSRLIDEEFDTHRPEFPQANRRRSNTLYWISQAIFFVGLVGASCSATILIKGGAIPMGIRLAIGAASVVCLGVGYRLGRASLACKPLSEHMPVPSSKFGTKARQHRRLKSSAVYAYHRALLTHLGFETIGIHQRENVGPKSTYRETWMLETFISPNGTTMIQIGLNSPKLPVFFVQVFSQLTNQQTVTTWSKLDATYSYPEPEDSKWLLAALARHEESVLQECETRRCKIALINQHNFEHVVQNEELQIRSTLPSVPDESTTEQLPALNLTPCK